MPWTSLCCSELHRCLPVFLTAGQPGAPASSIRLPTWFVTGKVWSFCSLSTLWVSGNTAVALLPCFPVRTATHCGSFRNDDILQCPEQFCNLYPVRTCFSNATLPTTALVLWQLQRHFIDTSVFCMLLSFADTTK